MNNKTKSILLLILGIYLSIGNTILSMVFNYAGPIGFDVPITPLNYWANWLNLYGFITLIPAAVGIYLIILSIRIYKRTKGASNS